VFIVLESPQHGPEICSSVQESLPPQGSGIPIRGWDWTAVEGARTLNGTTWGTWHVTGTFDGDVFVLTEPPGSADGREHDDEGAMEVRGPSVEAETEGRLAAVQQEVVASGVSGGLGRVQSVYIDPRRRVVVATVSFADAEALRFAHEHWGDLVELRSLLEPVE
jgi:hypothetical protein